MIEMRETASKREIVLNALLGFGVAAGFLFMITTHTTSHNQQKQLTL